VAMTPSNGIPAVFLDKDGTLIHNVPYNVDPARVELLPRVADGLRRLQDAGFRLIVVSNQPGVALGRFPASALAQVEARIDELLAPFDVILTAYQWCLHHPAGSRAAGAAPCACRKPRPGMLIDAAARHGIALERSWMVGDILDDVEAGTRAGCRTILVDRGNETRWRAGKLRQPQFIVYDFTDAVSFILAGGRKAHRDKAGAACLAGVPHIPERGTVDA
jgi:D-glycero-D-manno-heptose 1,7-bisphosphate phosphatase